jgi:hypothetical protein
MEVLVQKHYAIQLMKGYDNFIYPEACPKEDHIWNRHLTAPKRLARL